MNSKKICMIIILLIATILTIVGIALVATGAQEGCPDGCLEQSCLGSDNRVYDCNCGSVCRAKGNATSIITGVSLIVVGCVLYCVSCCLMCCNKEYNIAPGVMIYGQQPAQFPSQMNLAPHSPTNALDLRMQPAVYMSNGVQINGSIILDDNIISIIGNEIKTKSGRTILVDEGVVAHFKERGVNKSNVL
jgi:hypothetical protein